MYHHQSGAALVTVLLYLFVITLFVLSGFWMSALQFKMGYHFQVSERAFQSAESALLAAEADINESVLRGEGNVESEASYQFERISSEICGMWFYQIRARSVYMSAVRALESVVLLPVYNEGCPEVLEKKRRVLWREVVG